MRTVFTTDTFDNEVKFDGFRDAVCSQIARLFLEQIGTGDYTANIRTSNLGSISMSYVTCDPVVIERSSDNIREDDQSFFLTLQCEGRGHLHHMGSTTVLEAGDFTLIDSALPYIITFDHPVRRLVARIKRRELIGRGFVSENYCGRIFHGSDGSNSITPKLLMMGNGHSAIDTVLAHSLSEAVLDSIIAAGSNLHEPIAEGLNRSQSEMLRRIRNIVLSNLSDPDLSTSFIAAEAGISVRYLHKIFKVTGTTVNKWVQDERLERSYRYLASQNHRHRSILDIAYSCGFNDSGYFSNRFSKKFGKSPKGLRAQYTTGQS